MESPLESLKIIKKVRIQFIIYWEIFHSENLHEKISKQLSITALQQTNLDQTIKVIINAMEEKGQREITGMENLQHPKKQLQSHRDEIDSFKAKIDQIENVEEMVQKIEGVDE